MLKLTGIPGAIFGLCVIRPRRYLTVSVDRPNPSFRNLSVVSEGFVVLGSCKKKIGAPSPKLLNPTPYLVRAERFRNTSFVFQRDQHPEMKECSLTPT